MAVDPNVVCGTCRWCTLGRPNLCVHLTPIGVGRPGAAAEFVAVPARNALPVKDSVGDGAAAMIEPLACAMHAVRSARGVKGRGVLVIGGGTMGMLIALAAKAQGAGSVSLSDPSATKRGIAAEIGIEDARAPTGFAGEAFDVVFEAVGVPRALEQGLELLEKTGTLVQVGVHDADKSVPINPFLVYEREHTIRRLELLRRPVRAGRGLRRGHQGRGRPDARRPLRRLGLRCGDREYGQGHCRSRPSCASAEPACHKSSRNDHAGLRHRHRNHQPQGRPVRGRQGPALDPHRRDATHPRRPRRRNRRGRSCRGIEAHDRRGLAGGRPRAHRSRRFRGRGRGGRALC